jgi:hypothetical protein
MIARENRLLLIVIVVSAAALLLLARFRFPGEQRPVNPAPAPLERLAAQATFDDLASIIAQTQTRIAPALLALRVTGRAPQPPSLTSALEPPDRAVPTVPRLVLAARVREDMAVAHLAAGDRVDGIIGVAGRPETLTIDPVRMLGLVRVPPESGPVPSIWDAQNPLSTARYVAVAEATPGGPSLRPLFLGRTDPFTTARWDRPLVALGAAGASQPGAAIFALNGRLEGLTMIEQRLPVMVPVRTLLAAVGELERGPAGPPGDLGIELADLTAPLIAATGADHGAVVAYVRPNGPANGLLQIGDVVLSAGGLRVLSAEALTIKAARTAPGTPLPLEILRRESTSTVTVRVAALPERAVLPSASGMLGLTLRATADGAQVVRVADASAAQAATIAAGDVITAVGDVAAPSPAAVERAFRVAAPGAYLLVGVRRGASHIVIGLQKP